MIETSEVRISISDTMSLVAQLTGRQCGCEIGSKKEAIDYFLGTFRSRVGDALADKYAISILKSRNHNIAKNFVTLVVDEADGKLPPTVKGDFKAQGDNKMIEPNQAPTETESNAVATTEGTPSGRKGRKSQFSGKRLNAVEVGNTRRACSSGWFSLQIILDNPGITTEDYLEKGGRSNDLKWDIDHGTVIAS